MKNITIHELQKVMQEGRDDILVVDVRSSMEHKGHRIPSVKNIPMEELHEHIETFKKYKTVYLHCNSGVRSAEACKILAGLDNIVNVEGGIMAWSNAGFTTKKKRGHISLMRQVQIIAGGLVLVGSLLALFFSPLWILLSGFVGAGLLFAGITGFCGMAKILEILPWNK